MLSTIVWEACQAAPAEISLDSDGQQLPTFSAASLEVALKEKDVSNTYLVFPVQDKMVT